MQKILIADPTGGLDEARQTLELGPFTVTTADDIELIAIMSSDVDMVLVDSSIATELIDRLAEDPQRPRILVVGEAVAGCDGHVPAPPDPGQLMEVAMEVMSRPASASPPETEAPAVEADAGDPFSMDAEDENPFGGGDDDLFDPASMLDDTGDNDLDDLLGNLDPVDTETVESVQSESEPELPGPEPEPESEIEDGGFDPAELFSEETTPPPEGPIPDELPGRAPTTDPVKGMALEGDGEDDGVEPDDNPTTIQPVPTEEAPVRDEDTAPDIWALDGEAPPSQEVPTEKKDVKLLRDPSADGADSQADAAPDFEPDDSPTRVMSLADEDGEKKERSSDEEAARVALAQAEFSRAPDLEDPDEELVALFAEFELPAIRVEVHEPNAPDASPDEGGAGSMAGVLPEGESWDGPTIVSPENPAALEAAADRIERAVLRYAGYAPLQTIPEVFGRLVAEGETGTLLLRQGEVVKSIAFVEGGPVFATSSQRTDRLGEILYRAAMLSRDQLDEALEEVNKTGMSLGKVLLGKGILNPLDLYAALRRQVLEIIYSVFAWRRGEFSFLTGEPATEDRFPLPLTGAGVVMEGIRRAWTLPEILERFGGKDTVPVLNANRYFSQEDLDLTETEAKIQGAVDGERSIAALLDAFPGSEEDAARVLYTLLCVGGVRVEDKDAAGANGSAFDDVSTSREVPASELVQDSPRTGGVPDPEELKRRIREKHKQIKEGSYFEILGVQTDSPDVDIKAAFLRMEKAFRPERYGAPEYADVQGQVKEIYGAIQEAWQVLQDPTMRASYRKGLAK